MMDNEKQMRLPSVNGNDPVTLGQWHFAEGDHVKKGQDLVQVEAGKAVEELSAPVTGIINQIKLTSGQTARPGQVLAVFKQTASDQDDENDHASAGGDASSTGQTTFGTDESIDDLLGADEPVSAAAEQTTSASDLSKREEAAPKPDSIVDGQHLDTVVIGAGPGGYVAAIRAAELGQDVTVVENRFLGGVCLNVGCIPSKALIQAGHNLQTVFHSRAMGIHADDVTLDMGQVHQFKNQTVKRMTDGVASLFKKHHIHVLWGRATITAPGQIRVSHEGEQTDYSYRNLIIATGSRPVTIKNLPIGGRVLDSTGALDLEEVPKSMLIVGGGHIGCELASAYANFGSQVTIMVARSRIMANWEADMAATAMDDFAAKNVQILTKTRVTQLSAKDDSIEVGYEKDGQLHSTRVDYVVVAKGRRPNTDQLGLEQAGVVLDSRGLIEVNAQCRTNVPHIYAIGDVVSGPALAHKASYQGKIVAAAIAGRDVSTSKRAMPAVCYVNTPLATTGLTAEQARQAGRTDVHSVKFPLLANGRAVTMNSTQGFVRLVYQGRAKWLIGAQIAGVAAEDLIGELSLAIDSGRTVADLANTIAPHPSLGEAVLDCADLALGLPINI